MYQKTNDDKAKAERKDIPAVVSRSKLGGAVRNLFFKKSGDTTVAEKFSDLDSTESSADLGTNEVRMCETKLKRTNKFIGAAKKAIGKTIDGLGFSVAFGAAAVGSVVLFRMLNKTKVYGLKNIPKEHENVLYCINHNSLLDNFIFEAAAYVPKIFFQPKYLPINLADRKNFFGDPSSRKLRDRVMRILGRHFFRHLKAYPVDRRTGNMEQVEEWRKLLKDNIMIVYPEGTRSRTGKVGHGKPGVGKLIHEARPIVMPVFMAGTAQVLGVGMKFPTVFKTMKVYIGKPMDLSHLFLDKLPGDRLNQMLYYTKLSEAVMDEIRNLDPEYRPSEDDLPAVHQQETTSGTESNTSPSA
ncbi:MAG: lysophospholipid acyltransferase family protein [Candidatus Bruticola sp.]